MNQKTKPGVLNTVHAVDCRSLLNNRSVATATAAGRTGWEGGRGGRGAAASASTLAREQRVAATLWSREVFRRGSEEEQNCTVSLIQSRLFHLKPSEP